MRKNELVYYFAHDRKWMSKEQANMLLQRAEEEGFLCQENGTYSPRFALDELTIPIGFKPTSAIFERNEPTQELIRRIAKTRDMQETEVVAEMNRIIKDGYDGNLLPPAALVVLAKKYEVTWEDLRNALRQSVKKG